MLSKIEGIVISKVPYDERHIISSILLRSGRKVSVIFYGGRGGGSKQKSSIIELGFMLAIELKPGNKSSDVYTAKEWSIIWHHDKIRNNHQAFYSMCFFLEVMNKISPIENLFEFHEENKEMVGLFATLSNSIVLLEKSLESNEFYPHSHSVIFFIKLFLHTGIYPEREHCTLCGQALVNFNDMYLLSEEGGFACPVCMNQRKSFGLQSGRELWELMGHIAHKKYNELHDIKLTYKSLPKMLFHYFCFQNHFEEKDFKSHSMVF